jgi:hypothetical protein
LAGVYKWLNRDQKREEERRGMNEWSDRSDNRQIINNLFVKEAVNFLF